MKLSPNWSFGYTSPVTSAERLSLAFERATSGEGSVRELAAAVCDYTAFLQQSGFRPEQMLVAVKRALGFDASGVCQAAPAHDEMIQQMIARCIRHYYRAPER